MLGTYIALRPEVKEKYLPNGKMNLFRNIARELIKLRYFDTLERLKKNKGIEDYEEKIAELLKGEPLIKAATKIELLCIKNILYFNDLRILLSLNDIRYFNDLLLDEYIGFWGENEVVIDLEFNTIKIGENAKILDYDECKYIERGLQKAAEAGNSDKWTTAPKIVPAMAYCKSLSPVPAPRHTLPIALMSAPSVESNDTAKSILESLKNEGNPDKTLEIYIALYTNLHHIKGVQCLECAKNAQGFIE